MLHSPKQLQKSLKKKERYTQKIWWLWPPTPDHSLFSVHVFFKLKIDLACPAYFSQILVPKWQVASAKVSYFHYRLLLKWGDHWLDIDLHYYPVDSKPTSPFRNLRKTQNLTVSLDSPFPNPDRRNYKKNIYIKLVKPISIKKITISV